MNALAFVVDGLYYGVSDFAYAAYSMVYSLHFANETSNLSFVFFFKMYINLARKKSRCLLDCFLLSTLLWSLPRSVSLGFGVDCFCS